MYAYASQFKKPNKNTGSVVRVTLFAFFKEYCQGLKVFFLTGCVKIFFQRWMMMFSLILLLNPLDG